MGEVPGVLLRVRSLYVVIIGSSTCSGTGLVDCTKSQNRMVVLARRMLYAAIHICAVQNPRLRNYTQHYTHESSLFN